MFLKRKIDVEISLGTGTFGETGKNTVTLSGLRVAANITKAGMPSMDTGNIRVWGLTRSQLNQLTRLGKPFWYQRDNTITVRAGDDESGMSEVFAGTMINAYADFMGMPDVSLNVTAAGSLIHLARPVAPLSFAPGAEIATIAQQIAANMDKSFMNSGVTGVLSGSVYLPGTAIDQLRALLAAVPSIDADPNAGPAGQSLEIWPRQKPRGTQAPLLSKNTGLVGYPQFNDMGVGVTAIYQPGFIYGGRFVLETEVTPARGDWNIVGLAYDLESEVPDAPWFVDITGARGIDSGGTYE